MTTPPHILDISRDRALALGRETVYILEQGTYTAPSGRVVDIRRLVDQAVHDTVSYPPEAELPEYFIGGGSVSVEVLNITTLAGVRYLMQKGFQPAALNFASAGSPGGGFLSGARAQEEYLARSSGLYACLRENPMYAYHRAKLDPFYSDHVLYSPLVPVIRDDAGQLLEAPYLCSIITSPAVHATGVRKYMPERVEEIGPVMWKRILKVLAVAQHHGHTSLVLGAWGCGAFGNDSFQIARLFRKALQENFKNVFEYVVFAITDWSAEGKFIGPFQDVFGEAPMQTP